MAKRLTKHDWLEAEELYRQGWTQKQISQRFGVRVETVSIHMNRKGVKGGQSMDVARQEMEAIVTRKTRDFMEKRANRTVDTKEKFHTLINTTLAFFVRELKDAQDTGKNLDHIAGSAKALREAVSALKTAREELYTILEIKPDNSVEDAPDLFVMTMSEEDENAIRSAKVTIDNDADDEAEMAEEIGELEDIASEIEQDNNDRKKTK